MNLGDLTNFVEKPLAAVSNIVNTPNSAGRYRPFYLRNLLDAVQGRNLNDAVKGKVVLITGGSSGIGAAAAKKIAEAGGTVVLVARTLENLENVANDIRAIRGNGGTAHVYPCDLSDMDAIAVMADQVHGDLGGVDILINNAGRSIRRSLELSYDRIHDYQRTMQLNYLGAVQLILKFIPECENATSGISSTFPQSACRPARRASALTSPARPRWTACVMRCKPRPCTTTSDSPPCTWHW